MKTFVAKMTEEERIRLMQASARRKAMEIRPQNYNRQEIEEIVLRDMALAAELVQKYEVRGERDWVLSPYDGSVGYED